VVALLRQSDVGNTDRPSVQLADMLKLIPTPLADAYLIEQFPGVPLSVIDGMDFHRLTRALEVQRMRDVEAKRRLAAEGKAPDGLLSAEDWRLIREMDRIAGVE